MSLRWNFPGYWPFVRGINRSPVNSSHKGQWRGALMFSLICAWINGWVNIREAGDLGRHRAHHHVTVMQPYAVVRLNKKKKKHQHNFHLRAEVPNAVQRFIRWYLLWVSCSRFKYSYVMSGFWVVFGSPWGWHCALYWYVGLSQTADLLARDGLFSNRCAFLGIEMFSTR